MSGRLYTIGHTNHELGYFAELLQKYNIGYLIDVRSTPYSKYTPQFNKSSLTEYFNDGNVKYFSMAKYFGARRSEVELYSDEGYVDFDKVRSSPVFKKGAESIIKGLEKGNNIVLMCTEKQPIDCHRAIMAARYFALQCIPVRHILPNGNYITQEQLDNQLLDMYFPNRNQLTFDGFSDSGEEIDYLEQAYKLRNKEIGYRLDNNGGERE